ncbi:ABC transporter ATP-binding protein [Candidatus Formimonas warabiya]|uniref:Dipeptide/oligopeptide/nickel ABC transporter ATP-binding protein n=1 Tax=Formimonas warabiya TaxID=1761012 RepID=A0A3G1KS19_FORW1|nr:ABC transporter ATP-binding protein [Candidatus Formimonas warabiya]ATW25269.1 dipeptide/oligopeptide/nickel ABC transporter ATP-binding protein [Candidatus Formimonas warabiya]
MAALLEVQNITTQYRLKDGFLNPCDQVSFTVEKGEGMGLVGESACGKSSMALSLMKLLPDNGRIINGQVLLDGRDISRFSEEEMKKVRWKEMALIFQGAMNALNPVRTVGDQIVEAIRIHEKIPEQQAWKRAKMLLESVEIDGKRVRQYPHEFSGGMRQRVMIAMGIACNPKIVIGDEPTTGLDVMVKSQILQLLERLRREKEMGMILITHDLSVVVEICEKVAVMYAGKIMEYGPTDIVFEHPAHPYTRALINAFPNIYGDRQLTASIPGSPPNLLNPPAGCRFHPRCSCARPVCSQEKPELLPVGGGHYSACPLVVR